MKKSKPMIEAEDGEVELAPKKRNQMWVQRGYVLRPKTGGGRIPVLLAAVASDAQEADYLIGLKLKEVEAAREYKFEEMHSPESWGSGSGLPRAWFFVGHGVSQWERKHLDAQIA